MKKTYTLTTIWLISMLTGSLSAQFTENQPVVISDPVENADYINPRITAVDSGYYITWYDETDNFKMYMQYVDPKGYVQWDSAAVVTDYPQDTWISRYELVSDSQNAYVIFSDARNGVTDKDIFAYKLNSQGEFLWGEAGIELVASNGDYDAELGPVAAVLDNGNILAAWNKMDESGQHVLMQQITDHGDTLWDGGVIISVEDADIYKPKVVPAGNGMAYVAYIHQEGGMYGDRQIHALLINSNGENVWGEPVIVTDNSGIGQGRSFQAAQSVHGGLYVAWYGDPDANMLNDVFAQYVNVDGEPEYEANGVNLSPDDNMNQTSVIILGENHIGNGMFAWNEVNGGYTAYMTKLQEVDSDGNLLNGQEATTISEQLGVIGHGAYHYGNVYIQGEDVDNTTGYMAIYDVADDNMHLVEADFDLNSYSGIGNGQFVMVDVNESGDFEEIQLQNVYHTGDKGIDPIISDAELSGLAGLKGFIPASMFYYLPADTNHTWNSFASPMNIYQHIQLLDSPAYESGNYRVKVMAEDSTVNYYQFSFVEEPAANVDSVFSEFLVTHIDTENHLVLAELQLVKDTMWLKFDLSPGARLYINGYWDAEFSHMNDTARNYFYMKDADVDSAFVDFEVVDYTGQTQDWTLVMTIGGGGINRNASHAQIYPNPASDRLYVKALQPIEAVSVLTIDGRTVKSMAVNRKETIIPVEELNPGLYLLSIQQNGQAENICFIKQ